MDKISTFINQTLDENIEYNYLQPPLGEPIHIHTLTYKRTKNLGNYESEALEATALITIGEDPKECYEALKAYVEEQLVFNSIRF